MNILFFLLPKSEVAFIETRFSIRQTLEKMEYHRYSAVPMLNEYGEYAGTLTEGDLLWYIKDKKDMNTLSAENTSILDVPRRNAYLPVSANSNMEDLISKAMNQNFIPVVDDSGKFIGIITRKDIIDYCYKRAKTDDLVTV